MMIYAELYGNIKKTRDKNPSRKQIMDTMTGLLDNINPEFDLVDITGLDLDTAGTDVFDSSSLINQAVAENNKKLGNIAFYPSLILLYNNKHNVNKEI